MAHTEGSASTKGAALLSAALVYRLADAAGGPHRVGVLLAAAQYRAGVATGQCTAGGVGGQDGGATAVVNRAENGVAHPLEPCVAEARTEDAAGDAEHFGPWDAVRQVLIPAALLTASWLVERAGSSPWVEARHRNEPG